MIIKHVEATNFKGRNFAYDLSAMNAIVGDNFTGKTSIIDAIRLSLIGHIPELGKTNAGTWQLSSGERMECRVFFDGQEQPMYVAAQLDGDKVIVGRSQPLDIPLLNAAAYFAMSERERYEYVFRIAAIPESFTAKSIIAGLERISLEEKHTEAVERAKSEAIALIRSKLCDAPIQQCLTDAIEAMRAAFTKANGRAKDTQGAIRVMAELKNRQAQAGDARQLRKAEVAAQTEAENAYKEVLRLQTQAKDYDKRAERQKRVDELRKAVLDDTEEKAIEKRIGEAKAMLKPKVQSKVGEAELERLESHLARLTRDHTEAANEIRNAKKALASLKSAQECPYCHSTGDDWKKTLRAGLTETLTFNEGRLAGAESAMPEVQAKIKAARAEIERARTVLADNKTINANILTWQSQLDALRAKMSKWRDELDKESKALNDAVKPVTQEELDAAAAKATEAKARLADASARLKAADALEHDLQRAAQAEIEHHDAAAAVAVIKAMLESLRAKQAELVDTVFGDLLVVANLIAGPLLPTDLAFHEGEVGRWSGHRWISHKTFSGTEQALTFVATAAALSRHAPLRLLIFDELGRLDAGNRERLIDLLKWMLKNGHIDQFIVAGTAETMPLIAGMTVIEL